MRLYIEAKTNIQDVVIDVLELKLHDGKIITLDWDESEHGVVNGIYSARFKGISGCVEGEDDYKYLNGEISLFKQPFEVSDIQLYTEEEVENDIFEILSMEFEDSGEYTRIVFKGKK